MNCFGRPVSFALGLALGAALGANASAASFLPTSLIALRCSNGSNAEKVFLDEYDLTSGTPTLRQTIALPYTGVDAVTLPGLTNHDRHIHRSTDGRFLTFPAYNADYGTLDPSAQGAAAAARIIAIVKYDGSVDLTTRLTSAFDYTSVRGAVTTNGVDIWVAGDNASGATVTGGTIYTTKGAGTVANLSQVQGIGGPRTPDNIRDINVFDGQLYNSSGSGSSVGKATFRVGAGLPTSGSQTLTRLFALDASTSCFEMLDADANTPGVDVLYVATSTGNALRKFNLVAGVWQDKGTFTGITDIEEVVARVMPSGTATLYCRQAGAGADASVFHLVDPQPYGGTISGSLPSALIEPPAGFTWGGISFAPHQPGDANCDGAVNNFDIDAFVQAVIDPQSWKTTHSLCDISVADVNLDGSVNNFDIDPFVAVILGN